MCRVSVSSNINTDRSRSSLDFGVAFAYSFHVLEFTAHGLQPRRLTVMEFEDNERDVDYGDCCTIGIEVDMEGHDVSPTKLCRPPQVAVLLATYNGAQFVDAQIASLTKNNTKFTLHWLDDHSTDNTRDVVRACAETHHVDLREWHQDCHLGVPGTFFQLVECVQADIYLFCDQDDIWQSGKIDAVVANLTPELESPVLCFSECLMFREDPSTYYRVWEQLGIKLPAGVQESRSLMTNPVFGQSCALTGALRNVYLRHSAIARTHAFMHSWWFYLIAHATGNVRVLFDVPATLYRRHCGNATAAAAYGPHLRGYRYVVAMWRMQQWLRRGVSRQAKGFILASETLAPSARVDRLLSTARIVATLDKRQSPLTFLRLARSRAMWPHWQRALWFAVACLCCNAGAQRT